MLNVGVHAAGGKVSDTACYATPLAPEVFLLTWFICLHPRVPVSP